MKASLTLNTFAHDLMNLLHYEQSLQKHKNIFISPVKKLVALSGIWWHFVTLSGISGHLEGGS